MNWVSTIERLYAESAPRDGWKRRPSFSNAASAEQLDHIEVELRCRLPATLRTLLIETNGVMDMMAFDDAEWFENLWIVWPVEEIVERNRWARDNYASRHVERYVFFSSPGTDGILFGCLAPHQRQLEPLIYAWYPDESEDRCVARTLERFVHGMIVGGISV